MKFSIIKLNNSKKGKFIIPAIFIKYVFGNKLLVRTTKNYRKLILEKKEFKIKSELVRLVSEDTYNYFNDYEEDNSI